MLSTIKPPVWFIIFIIGFPQLSETIFAPLLPFIVKEFWTTQTMSQMTLSVYFTGFAFGVLFWGVLSDIIGRKKALIFGLLTYTIGSFLLYTSKIIEILLCYRVIQAFGAASGSIISQTLLRECFTEEKERIQTFSLVSAALAWTPALGPLLGGQLVGSLGMRSVFLFLVFLGASLFFCTQGVLKEKKIEDKKRVKFKIVLKRMILDGEIYLYVFLIAGLNAVIFSTYSESPFIFMKIFNWTPKAYSFIGFGMAIFSVYGAYLNRTLSKKDFKPKTRIQIGLLWVLVSSLLLVGPAYLLPNSHQFFLMAWTLFFLCFIFIGVVIALPSILSEALHSYHDCLGTAGALLGLSYYLVLSLFLGIISQFSSENLYFLGLVIMILSVLMLLSTKLLPSPKAKS